jgi:hypothetical protein
MVANAKNLLTVRNLLVSIGISVSASQITIQGPWLLTQKVQRMQLVHGSEMDHKIQFQGKFQYPNIPKVFWAETYKNSDLRINSEQKQLQEL